MVRRLSPFLAVAAVAFGLSIGGGAAAAADGEAAVTLHLPAQPLPSAVTALAQRVGWTLGGRGELLRGKQAPALDGRYRPEAALRRLLAGSGVTFELTDAGVVRLVPVSQDGSASLGAITVEGDTMRSAGQTEGSDAYASDAVTIGKTTQALKDIPQSVSVVTRAQIEDWQLDDLAAAVAHVPGVTVRDYGADQYEIISRGYTVDSYLVDGSPMASGGGSWEGNGLFDMALYDRVEVLRGPAGMLQGAGEPAGAVNLARKRALADPALNATLSAGSWDSYRGVLDTTGALDDQGRLRGRLVAVYDDRGSFVDEVNSRNTVGYGTLEYDITDRATWSVGLTQQDRQARPYSGLPTTADGELLDVSRSTYLGSHWDRLDSNNQRYFTEFEYVLDNGGLVTLKANRIKRDTEIYKSSEASAPVDSSGMTAVRRIHSQLKETDDYLEAQVETPFRLFGRSHEAVLGASYQNSENDYTYDYGDPQYAYQDVDNPNHHMSEPEFGHAPGFTLSNLKQYAAYGQLRAHLSEPVTLVLGGRLNRWKTENGSNLAGLSGDDDIELTPSAGLLYALSPDINAYVSYSAIFQPQTAVGFDGEPIDPREGEQIEAGVKGERGGGRLNWHIAAFRIEDKNRAYSDPANPGYSIPRGEARSRGVIAELTGTLLPRWEITAGYAYTDTEYTRDPDYDGLALSPEAPKHDFSLWTRYRFSDDVDHGWRIGAGMHTRSETYIESGYYLDQAGVRVEQGGYTTYSAMVGYRVNPSLDFTLNGENLTDKKYYSSLNTMARHNYYGEPRNFTLTMRYNY